MDFNGRDFRFRLPICTKALALWAKDQMGAAPARRIAYQIKMNNCYAYILLLSGELMFD